MDPNDNLELDFQELLKMTINIVKLRKKLSSIIKFNKKNSQVSNLVDRCDKDALISSTPNPFTPLPNSIFKPPVTNSATNFIIKLEDKNVKQLIEMM